MEIVVTARLNVSLRCCLCAYEISRPTGKTHTSPPTGETFEFECVCGATRIWRTLA